MQSLREEFEAVWQRHVGEHSFWQAWSALDPESAGFVRDSLQMPGKRLRPLLFGLACQAFGCDSLTGLMPAALALELAHNFILVHDDVIDGSDERRGVPVFPSDWITFCVINPRGISTAMMWPW